MVMYYYIGAYKWKGSSLNEHESYLVSQIMPWLLELDFYFLHKTIDFTTTDSHDASSEKNIL